MKHIKFRAWDRDAQQMITPAQMELFDYLISPTGDNVILVQSSHYVPGLVRIKKMPDLVPLQYTGCKDKNGKEIYEGDIIENNSYVDDFELGTTMSLRGVVKWAQREWYIKGLNFDDLINSRAIEVVGNVYDNPELLEDPSGTDEDGIDELFVGLKMVPV